MGLPLDEDKSIVKNNSKWFKMATTNNFKKSWKNDLRQSVVEQDVLKLRNKLKIIQNSPEFKMSDYRLNTRVRENNWENYPVVQNKEFKTNV